ncbi:hypothetical protein Sango_2917500 [Sesamum angolense]|uniref:Uncharacterized protein n=1 Tax=Sesamum angolense TaxID=2727404 RepID=A0AAE1W038_9LAMI|nr:hypothetical protein Sango_2917500 [Sesamum angolense]
MADNEVREEASAGEDGGFSPLEPAHVAAAEGAGDSVDQMDPAVANNKNALGSFHNEANDTRTVEEGVREDMFVDCPDEIETSESQQNSEGKDNPQDDQADESDSGIKVEQLLAEIERLRDMHEQSVSEKERFAREYEEERMLMKELAQVCYRLKVPNEQQITPVENADGLVDHLQTEVVHSDVKTLDSGASLREMISGCSMFLKNALDEHLQTQEIVRELHSVLYMKDQEIDVLNAKFAELSESSNTTQSNSNSEYQKLSQLYELQLEKDGHIEEIANRISASLSMLHHQEEPFDGSLTEKINNIEKSLTFLVEKYKLFVSESDQLRGCLNEEENLSQNIINLESENLKLVEELEKQRSEIGRLSAEVDQERNRYANTKEKLSMAVTKGKALVQQRDSLKQLLAEKTSELEKCAIELQEKSSALEAAEKTKELIGTSEMFAASLQESLSEKEMILQRCGEILSESVATEELQHADITEKLRWLADENNFLKAVALQYQSLTDALSSFDFPESVGSTEFDERVRWLAESFSLYKEEAMTLQSEIAKIKEAANMQIDHLTTSLLAETQENSYLQVELEDLRNKYEAHERLQHEVAEAREAVNNEIDDLKASLLAESQEKNHLQLELENLRQKYEEVVQKEYHVSLEKDRIVSMLLEASGLANDSQGEAHPEHSEMTTIIDNCLAKIKENTCHVEPSQFDSEIFESFKGLLYIRDQEMSLYKLIIEEDILDRVQVGHLSSELEMKTQELNSLKDEKDGMKKSLEQLEDRCALLKEKLSMAVKKGKGLVQERENLKGVLSEKDKEIHQLKSELQQNLDRYTECQDQISKLSLDVERISLLETDLVATKERADQLEQFLAESNNMLQRVMESIEGITTPHDLSFGEPVDKVKWIAGHLREHEISKLEVQEELKKVKDEASSLAIKLSQVQTMMESLEDALSIAENSRSELLDEKKELEVSKALLEEELQKEKEIASSHTIKFEELSVSKRALEDAMSLSEDNTSRLMSERDIALESRALAEDQLQKLKDEFSNHTTKLADADRTIQSLEDALSQAQENISLLAEENSKVQIGNADLDSEMKKVREEADSYASKLSDASLTIKSLEDALLNAENTIADLVQEKKYAEQEILALSSKLESCMQELAGSRGSVLNRSVELSSQLSRLQLLLKDERLSSLLGQCFERKFESLKDMDVLLKEMGDFFLEMDTIVLQNSHVTEDESSISTKLPSTADIAFDKEILNDEVNAVDSESIMSHIEKMNERFHLKGKMLADKFENLSTLMDESNAALLRRLYTTKDRIVSTIKYTKSLKQQVKDMETDKQKQEDTIASLESDIRILLSACADATQELELNVRENVSELRSIHELVKLDGIKFMDLGAVGDDVAESLATDHVKMAEKLSLATRQNQDLSKHFQDAIKRLTSIAEDVKSKLRETQLTCDQVLEERDLYKDKTLKLETELEAQKNACREMTIKLDDYKEQEDKLRKREEELSTSLSKVLEETQLTYGKVLEERDLYKDKTSELESELEAQQNLCHEMTIKLDDYKKQEDILRKREEELSTLLSKVHDMENLPLSVSQVKSILDKMNEVEVPDAAFAVGNSHDSTNVRKLFSVIDGFSESLQKVSLLSRENEELQSTIDEQILEIEFLRKQVEDHMDNEKDSEKMNKLLELESGLKNIVWKLGGGDLMGDLKADGPTWLLPLLDKLVMAKMLESESSKSKNEEFGAKLLATQKLVDDLSSKVKLLEDSNQARIFPPEIEQEGGTSIATQSEISEMQDVVNLVLCLFILSILLSCGAILLSSFYCKMLSPRCTRENKYKEGLFDDHLLNSPTKLEILDPSLPLPNSCILFPHLLVLLAAVGMSNNIPHVQSAAHVRSLRKGSNDHLAISIGSESERLINNEETDEDKGHLFKSLNTSGLIPRQGRSAADRIDGIWVSGSRALMRHPRGRLGLIAYWLVLHIWLLGTIL